MSDTHDEPAPARRQTIHQLSEAPLDVLVIGGGIVGSGVARDAAFRGLRVGLVEQHDFAFGTSSRSSRLLHGGIRYLAQGRLGLVREASVEKRIIHQIAPHLATPLAFVFPTYRCSFWGPWALWKLRIGVKLYDLLCGGRNLGRSRSFNTAELAEYLPGINTDGLTGGVRYFDGLTQDARLVIDTLRSAASAGAMVLNYCRFEDARREMDRWRCQVRDRLEEQVTTLAARCVVNAAGPWAEQLPHSSVKLRLTKGVHLVVPRDRLPVPDAVVMTDGDRILFAIPWGQRVILGTTDTDYHGPIDAVRTEPEDVAYILNVVNRSFPRSRLGPDAIISSWAGLRPLIDDRNGKPSDISRAHEIRTPEPGWWDVAGGKLTTYRLMAEQTIDQIMRYLKHPRVACITATTPLLSPEEAAHASGLIPPEPTPKVVEHYCRREWAVHLDDVMIRRAGWHYYHAETEHIAAKAADWMAMCAGWDEPTRRAELDRYLRSAGTTTA